MAALFVNKALIQKNSLVPKTRRSIFDHVPKTGGTSVRAAFECATGYRNGLVNINTTYPHHIVVRSTVSPFLAAHIWFYAGEKLSKAIYYATLLREPVDRFVSQYYYHRQFATEICSSSVQDSVINASAAMDLERFLSDQSDEVRRCYSNMQASHYAARLSERPEDLSDSALLDAAITSLEDYDLVGVYSEIQTFFDRYCLAMGVPPRPLPTLNATSGRSSVSDLPARVRDKLIAANSVDLALVDWVCRRSTKARSSVLRRLRRVRHRTSVTRPADFGTRELEIVSASIQGQSNPATAIVGGGEIVEVFLTCHASVHEPDLTIGIAIRSSSGEPVIELNNKQLSYRISIDNIGEFSMIIRFVAPQQPGDYNFTVALHRGITHLDRCYHWRDRCASFTVRQDKQFTGRATADGSVRMELLQPLVQNVGHISPAAADSFLAAESTRKGDPLRARFKAFNPARMFQKGRLAP